MNLAVLRDMLLTASANRALAGADLAGLWPNAEAFSHLRRFTFVDAAGEVVAADPQAWFELLRSQGRRGVRVVIAPASRRLPGLAMPARQQAQFLNDGPFWRIEVVGVRSTAAWRVVEDLLDDPPHDKPYAARGVRIAARARISVGAPNLAQTVPALVAALDEMITLAKAEGMTDPFGDLFHQAQDMLANPASAKPAYGFSDDFIRFAGFDAARLGIAAAVGRAWVFGGMGSWNDVGPDGPAVDRLYDALNETCAALANSTYADSTVR